jgi:RHS repeat-associated protein
VKTEYDDAGRLKYMVDTNGEKVELVYDPNNSIQKVKDVFGKETTYVYDNRGNVLTEIDPLGKRIDRTFDADNNVWTETVITTELNAAGNPVEVKSKTEWTYDNRGNKLTEKDALGNVSRWTYNSRGQVLTETDALGNTATYTYSPSGNLLSTKDAKGNVTTYNYDARGNLLKLTDATHNSTNFTYNSAGDVTNLEDASGNKAAYIYDSNGNMKRETMTVKTPTGEKEFVTEWTYNDEGQIKSVTQGGRTVTYEYSGGRQSASIENNRRTEYRYNSQGKLVETIYPDDTPSNSDNPKTIAVYDKGGRQRATIDQSGRVTHYKYDDAGQLTETIYPDETPNQIQQLLNAISPGTTPQSVDWTNIIYPDTTPVNFANNSRTKTEYYKNGQVKAEIDVDGNRTEYEYDAANRVNLVRFDANNYITYTYDAVGNRKTETVFAGVTSTTTVYNSQGLVTAITDPNGKTTQFEYDERGQLKAVVDAAQKRTEYTYDSAGNLKTVKDALGQVTTYEYDDKGRRKAVIRPDNKKRSTFVYDDVANTVTITDFNNKTVKYTYNDLNQVVSKQYQNASGATVSVTYTANGLEETITDSRGATVYKYDDLGQLISRKDPTGPYLASGNSIEYKYESGQVSELKTPTRTANYTYYTEGESEGRLKTVSTPDMGTVTYVYYPDGNLWKTFYPNNLLETRTYDDLGRLDVVKTAKSDPITQQELQVISSFDYLVNAVGNRKEVVEQSGRKVEYKYDDLHRLVEEKVTKDPGGNNRVVTYTYDAVGNRLSKTDSVSGVTTYTYNNLNQLDFLTANNVVTDYTYDDNGNLISEVTGNNSAVYRWENDGENRLAGVTVTEGGVTRNVGYQYNAQGVRVGKVVDGVETRYLIDELQPYAQVVEEYDAAGNVKGSYVYGLDLLGRVSGMQREFYHSDGLGSTRLLTNGTGAVTDTYSYDAYGNLIARVGGSNNPYLFAGEQRDVETGLDYLRARYYDPLVGRFVSADAYEGTLNDPMSLHDYQYAHANPTNLVDPSGYTPATDGDILHSKIGLNFIRQIGIMETNNPMQGNIFTRERVYDPRSPYTTGKRPSLGRVIKTAMGNSNHPGVPRGTRGAGGRRLNNGSIYPDLVDFTNHEVYEIKPARDQRQIASGLAELNDTVNILHSLGRTDWRLGTSYHPPSIIPLAWIWENQGMNVVFPDSLNNVTRGRFAVVWNLGPGMIVYQINDPRLDLIAVGIGTAIAGLAAWLAYLMVEAASRSTATGGFA